MSETFEIPARTELSIKIYGTEFKVLRPTVAESREQLEAVRALEEPEAITEAWQQYLVNRGLPREVVDSVEADQMWQLVNFIAGGKKK